MQPDTLLTRRDSYTPEEVQAAAQQYSHMRPYYHLLEHVLYTAARTSGGFSYGGETVNGKPAGAIHIYDQRQVYRQVPDPATVAEVLARDPGPVIAELLGKMRTDHYMTWLRNRTDWPEIAQALDAAEGYVTAYGPYSVSIRTTPPDENCEVRQPETAPEETDDEQ